MTTQPGEMRRDAGLVLPLVLAVSVVLALVVLALATYATSTLSYGEVTEQRADRFAASQGAIDDALEKLALDRTTCSTEAGTVELTTDFPEINDGTTTVVECVRVGGEASSLDGWALIITGNGNPDHLLSVQSGGGVDKYFGGRVYVHSDLAAEVAAGSVDSLDFKAPTEIRGGDLWYPGSCAQDDFTALPEADLDKQGDLTFEEGFGTVCSSKSWDEMFSAPRIGAITATPDPDGAFDSYGCKVFDPGLYTSPPVLGKNNYFRNGNYLFANVGTISIDKQKVLFGNVDGLDGFPSIENTACNEARTKFDDDSGATVYVRGNTRFVVDGSGSDGGGLEFSGAVQRQPFPTLGDRDVRVSLQVLDGYAGNPTWNDPVVATGPGNKKELAVQSLIWAPDAGVQFGAVTNATTAALRGGAVVAKLDAGASASATGFLIEVPSATGTAYLQLTAVSTKQGVSSAVRAVVDYRPEPTETSLLSWRVCGTPDC